MSGKKGRVKRRKSGNSGREEVTAIHKADEKFQREGGGLPPPERNGSDRRPSGGGELTAKRDR